MNAPAPVTAILLAAGGSLRLGRPKQLLPWNGSTLIGSTINRLAMAGCERLIVVLGAYEAEVRLHCICATNVQLNIVTNVDWREGQATSLQVGVEYALKSSDIGASIIALCDQPLIDSRHYQELVARVTRLGFSAAATEYPEGLGVPACFSSSALRSLAIGFGNIGAKKWLRAQPPHSVGRVTCPAATMDIDTEHDYQERLEQGRVG